jgi:tetratricopeptide (TPR) repeat protein
MNNLATLLEDSGSYTEAAQLYDSSLAALNEHFQHSHPLTLLTLENYANLLYVHGETNDAENLVLQADELRQSLLELDKAADIVEEEVVIRNEWDKVVGMIKAFCTIL